MADLPVMLKVRGSRCVVVGGGEVARRRARALLDAGAEVTVIAPQVIGDLEAMPVRIERRAYAQGDLAGARLVVIATDDGPLNERIAADARTLGGVLVNRADDPDAGDVAIPAHAHHGPVTLAAHTSGISAAAARTIRRELSAALDPDWPRLLEIVAPHRRQIQETLADPVARRDRLRRLTDTDAMRILKTRGAEALALHCQRIVAGPDTP